MTVHLIGSGARGAFDIASTCRFDALLPIHGEAVAEGTLAGAKIAWPRKGVVDGRDCLDCVHLQTWRDKPDLVLHCAAHDRDPVGDWMRRKPPATTVETRCYAADQFAAARRVHHLLVFDRRL